MKHMQINGLLESHRKFVTEQGMAASPAYFFWLQTDSFCPQRKGTTCIWSSTTNVWTEKVGDQLKSVKKPQQTNNPTQTNSKKPHKTQNP